MAAPGQDHSVARVPQPFGQVGVVLLHRVEAGELDLDEPIAVASVFPAESGVQPWAVC